MSGNAIPVHILDVFQSGGYTDGGKVTFQVSIMCCFCGKKHMHGSGVSEEDGTRFITSLPPASLGQ